MYSENKKRVQLNDILSLIHNDDFSWRVLEFRGIGKAPFQISMSDFEDLILSKVEGVELTWLELKDFANSLEQTFECLIIGFDQNHTPELCNFEDLTWCDVIIEALDSTCWRITESN